MSHYESEPGVAPAHILTFRQQRRQRRWGASAEPEQDSVLYADFFRDTSPLMRRGRER